MAEHTTRQRRAAGLGLVLAATALVAAVAASPDNAAPRGTGLAPSVDDGRPHVLSGSR